MNQPKFRDSRTGAAAAVTALDHYGPFEPELCHYCIDPKFEGVWLVFHTERDFGVIVNTVTGEAIDEIPEWAWQEKYGLLFDAVTWEGHPVATPAPRVLERAVFAVVQHWHTKFLAVVQPGCKATLREIQEFCCDLLIERRVRVAYRMEQQLCDFDLKLIPAAVLAQELYKISNAYYPAR